MQLSLIAAMTKNRVIGKDNQMPWHLPADLKHFKQLTLGKPIVMGRKTYESIGKPLPQRRNIVISRQQQLVLPGCEVFDSLAAALNALAGEAEVMVIGGEMIFKEALPLADALYLTLIDVEMEGDTFFPYWQPSAWQKLSREVLAADAQNAYQLEFVAYQRIS